MSAFMSVTLGGVVLGGICLFFVFLLKDKEHGQNELVKKGKQYLVLGSLFFAISLWIVPWEQLLQIGWLNNTLGGDAISLESFGYIGHIVQHSYRHCGNLMGNAWGQTAHGYLWLILLCALLLQCGGYFGDIAHSAELTGKVEAERSDFTDDLYLCENMLPNYYYTTDCTHISCDIEEHFSWLNEQNSGLGVICREPETIIWSNYQKRGLNITADVSSEYDFSASFPLCLYPGYYVMVDGAETEAYSIHSLLTCDLTQGTHHIEISWKTPSVFRVCDIASLCCLAGWLLWRLGFGRTKRSSVG